MQVKVYEKDVSSSSDRQSTSKPFLIILCLRITPLAIQHLLLGETIHQWLKVTFYFFKPLPIGDHTINVEVIRQPLQANQPVEHDVAKWDIKVKP